MCEGVAFAKRTFFGLAEGRLKLSATSFGGSARAEEGCWGV